MSETGSVKFTCEHVHAQLEPFAGFEELNACRRRLLTLGLIGVDGSGIGYGNVSVRDCSRPGFYITGSATGAKPELTLDHYSRVTAVDASRNWLRCEGFAIASSESLTHAAVYEANPAANAIIHGHSTILWHRFIDRAPTTDRNVEYGTPAMAGEVARLFRETNVSRQKLFVMGGHEEGFVVFGAELDDAFRVLAAALSAD